METAQALLTAYLPLLQAGAFFLGWALAGVTYVILRGVVR